MIIQEQNGLTGRAGGFTLIGLLLVIASTASQALADGLPVRQTGEDINTPQFREQPGLKPDTNLLFNGWGITPAGEQVAVSDLALKLVVAPDRKCVIATHGGYNDHGVTVVDLAPATNLESQQMR